MRKSKARLRAPRRSLETISLIKEMAANNRRFVSGAHPWGTSQAEYPGKSNGRFIRSRCARLAQNAPVARPGKHSGAPMRKTRGPAMRLQVTDLFFLQRIIQGASPREANPQRPAWKADRRQFAVCLFSSVSRSALIEFKRHLSAMEADGCSASLPILHFFSPGNKRIGKDVPLFTYFERIVTSRADKASCKKKCLLRNA
jgi:hypothetical protein